MEAAPTAAAAAVAASGVLPLFWDLAATDAGARLIAAERLVDAAQSAQATHDANSSDGQADAAVDDDDLVRRCAPEVAYILKRLLRGLPSSRDGARQGFAVALTEVRSRPPCPTLSMKRRPTYSRVRGPTCVRVPPHMRHHSYWPCCPLPRPPRSDRCCSR